MEKLIWLRRPKRGNYNWLNMVFGVPRNPKSLRSLSLNAVQRVYKHNWHLVNDIPKTLQDELLTEWLQCNDSVPINDRDIAKIEAVVSRGWMGMKPFTPQVFVYLMMLPNEVPSFADEDNHVIWEYYIWKTLTREERLCLPCYISVAKPYRQYSANYWLDQGWQFLHVKGHSRVEGEDILNTIWDAESWCSRCICEPLIHNILDYDDCLFFYDYHRKRRRTRCWDTSSSSESESDEEGIKSVSLLAGLRTCPDMYQSIKTNKFFEW